MGYKISQSCTSCDKETANLPPLIEIMGRHSHVIFTSQEQVRHIQPSQLNLLVRNKCEQIDKGQIHSQKTFCSKANFSTERWSSSEQQDTAMSANIFSPWIYLNFLQPDLDRNKPLYLAVTVLQALQVSPAWMSTAITSILPVPRDRKS